MSTPPLDGSRITRVLKMRDPVDGTGKLAVEFETGSRAGTIVVTTDADGKHSFSFRDHPRSSSLVVRQHGAAVLPLRPAPCAASGTAGVEIRHPAHDEIEALHMRRDAIVRQSMKLLALPVYSYWAPSPWPDEGKG
ncbi:hypothetical protein [Roseomonas populi]|uniref:Carboxypeptidase regulatory-like domain-containing protein n=1 Tax=Roseomonas populi TaxID=3121582 RepID=A0ABT1XB35_9PROT|nr:hypothetical protein [Roseomonas pecuniae]MCR0985335.1 hypothetical protein [Roseomonas pecuniae]